MSALPPLDNRSHSVGSNMSLTSMSGFSSSGDGLDDGGSPVKQPGKRKRRSLLKKYQFDPLFFSAASLKVKNPPLYAFKSTISVL